MDNLNTHRPEALYEALLGHQAKQLMNRFEFVYMPKHESWLNIAERELQILDSQCLNQRIDNIEKVDRETLVREKV